MRRLEMLSLFVAILFLASCSRGGDPTAAAKVILENACQQQSQGFLRVVNFVKTDAVSSKRDGVDYYTLSFDIEVEGIQDGAGKYDDGVLMVPGHYLNICQRQGKDAEVMSFAVSNRLSRDNCFVFPVEKGHRYKVENNRRLKSMTLAKHESGWVVVEQ